MKCESCGKEVDEVCRDGHCRDCHKSLTFEDCMTHTFDARLTLELAKKAGIPNTKEFVKRIYPNAKI